MLTFQEALTLLKQGHDVRRQGWAQMEFIRATPIKQLQRHRVSPTLQTTTTAYTAIDADLFATDWRLA